jgi:TPR repeat protein
MRHFVRLLFATLAASLMLGTAGAAVAEPCIAADAEGRYSATKHVQCLREESEHGDDLGQYLLGVFYYLGEGIPQDYAEALKWFRRSADQGNSMAQFMLAGMYAQGKGVQKDFVQAHMWLNLAGAQGHEEAQQLRDTIAKKMTPAQVDQAQKLAREWKSKPER